MYIYETSVRRIKFNKQTCMKNCKAEKNLHYLLQLSFGRHVRIYVPAHAHAGTCEMRKYVCVVYQLAFDFYTITIIVHVRTYFIHNIDLHVRTY